MMHAASCSIVCSPSLWYACTLPGERGTSMARHCQAILMHASRKYLYAWRLNPMKTFHTTTAPAPFQARACQPYVMQRTSSCLSMLIPICLLVPLTTWRTCSVAAGLPNSEQVPETCGKAGAGRQEGVHGAWALLAGGASSARARPTCAPSCRTSGEPACPSHAVV